MSEDAPYISEEDATMIRHMLLTAISCLSSVSREISFLEDFSPLYRKNAGKDIKGSYKLSLQHIRDALRRVNVIRRELLELSNAAGIAMRRDEKGRS